MKLKELSKERPLLEGMLRRINTDTEELKKSPSHENITKQSNGHHEISGYIWGLYESGIITAEERNESIDELMKFQEVHNEKVN